jgi:hypothetical protein
MGAQVNVVQEEEEEVPLQSVPKHPVISDEAWLQQQRVPQDIQPVQPERIKIPEFADLGEVKPTVICPVPTQSTKVQWNEFPEEEQKEPGSVPRVKAQEWQPQNEVEHPVQKTNYQPGRIQRAWPPPGYNEEEDIQLGKAEKTKAQSDVGWIQGATENPEEETDAVGNAPWKRQVSGAGIKERVWPPPENVREAEAIATGPKLAVQWPPPETEEKEQQSVETIQTHLPVKPHQRQWPPEQPEMAGLHQYSQQQEQVEAH